MSSLSAIDDFEPGQQFLQKVRRSAINVLGESDVGRDVLELCEQHGQARRMVLEDRSQGLNVIAVIGAAGQGKSWLIRQMIHNAAATRAIKSGNNLSEATEKLIWVGPFPPADLDRHHENFVQCPADDMQSVGMPYLLVDTPGSTDDRQAIAEIAKRALSLASVLILVVRRDQLRSNTIAVSTHASEGTIVVPVVNAVRQDPTLQADVESFVSRIRQVAPTTQIADVVLVDDFDTSDSSKEKIGGQAAAALSNSIESVLGNAWEGDRRRTTRLAALDARFRFALHSVLSSHLPELTAAVMRLRREARALPGEVALSLLGNSGSLRAATRARLRLSFLTETAAFWFPYRTLLGLLNLTHGAWDRLLLSLSGSLPSLVSAVWTTTRNLASQRDANAVVREGLRNRSTAAVADRLGPLAANFRHELAMLRKEKGDATDSFASEDASAQIASLAGIDMLQEQSQHIFDQEVKRAAASRGSSMIAGVIGTLVFWALMSGPVVALYRGYIGASYLTLSEVSGDLSRFPTPDFGMLLTSVLLSVLPTAIFAMIVLSLAQSKRRVDRAETAIRESHQQAISKLQSDGILRLRWSQPLLADAEFLLSAGNRESTEDRLGDPLNAPEAKA